MLAALAHFQPAHVEATIELGIGELTDVIEAEQIEESSAEKVHELAIFFKGINLEKLIATKKPSFQIEMWNQYDAAREGVARTANLVAGWRFKRQAYFCESAPIFWFLFLNLEKISKSTVYKYPGSCRISVL